MTRKVSAQVVLDMPRGKAWDKLRDISLAHNYVPGIVRTQIVSEQREGVWASRLTTHAPATHSPRHCPRARHVGTQHRGMPHRG